MKAISLWQPWATAIVLGLKTIETRGWSTKYRGRLAIHAAKRWTREEREFAEDFIPMDVDIPLGALIAWVTLADCVSTSKLRDKISNTEKCWGNYSDRRYGWVFADVSPLPKPIPYRGEQGLFDVPDNAFVFDLLGKVEFANREERPRKPAQRKPAAADPRQGRLL